MKMLLNVFQQQRHILTIIGIITVIVIIMSIPLIFQTNIALDFLINDTVAEAKVPEYVGAISNIGIFLWIATATVCLFTAFIAWQQRWVAELCYFYVYAGILFIILGLDDAFLFHDSLFPQITGLSENVVFLGYLLLILGMVVLFWRIMAKTQYLAFVIAIMLLVFGGSVDTLHDVIKSFYLTSVSGSEAIIEQNNTQDATFSFNLTHRDKSWQANAMDIVEDAPKFLTIICFLVYFASSAAQHIKQNAPTVMQGNQKSQMMAG